MNAAAALLTLDNNARAALVQARAIKCPRLARLAQDACDLARAQSRGHEGEADMLTHRICRELWG